MPPALSRHFAAGIAFLVLLLASSAAQACSCRPFESTAQAYREADRVFSGEVIQVEAPAEANHFYVRVLMDARRAWKGGGADGEIELLTTSSSAACGVTFEYGVVYLVFAYDTGEFVTTNLCSGTKPLADALQETKDLDAVVAEEGAQ